MPVVRFLAFCLASSLAAAVQAQPVLITSPVTVNHGDTMIVDQQTSTPVPLATAMITVRGTTLTMNGSHAIASLVLERSAGNQAAVLTHSPGYTWVVAPTVHNGLRLTVDGDVVVQGASGNLVQSRIDVSSGGHPGGTGPTPGQSGVEREGGGGGHGGAGGRGGNGAMQGGGSHGDRYLPVQFGSGGGNATATSGSAPTPGTGGRGGGALQLSVGGTLQVDGQILANGGNGALPWYRAGGGAGGSVLISCDTLAGSGTIRANGGAGANSGGNGHAGGGGGGRVALAFDQATFTGQLEAFGGSGWQSGGAGTVYIKESSAALGELVIANGGALGAATEFSGNHVFNENITITGGGILSHPVGDDTLKIEVLGDLTINLTGRIDVSLRGHAGGTGPGAGQSHLETEGGGGSHGGSGGRGGTGATPGGACYGDIYAPRLFGSGGGNATASAGAPPTPGTGGRGGGMFELTVAGDLNVDGQVLANGGNGALPYYRAGGGAGGSILIECGTLSGFGAIRANGGAGANSGGNGHAGGGGGGRIAVYFDESTFTGQLEAIGGTGWQRGGAGTVFTKKSSSSLGTLRIDNGGNLGAATEFTGEVVIAADVILTGEGTLSHAIGDSTLKIDVLGDLLLEFSGRIDVSARGHAGGMGPKAGQAGVNSEGGGGGHGGAGGRGGTGAMLGGGTYGERYFPETFGSGGGNATALAGSGPSPGSGGRGGGILRLNVAGEMQLDGQVLSNGGVGTIPLYRAGGGGGGSIWIECGTLSGMGAIRANGGAGADSGGNGRGGGGGGGRIAVYFEESTYTGQMQAFGGAGWQHGGAGTVYQKKSSASLGTLRIFNNSTLGAATEFTGEELFADDIIIGGGGILSHAIGDDTLSMRVLGDMTVEHLGRIDMTGRGHAGGTGPGAGLSAINAEGGGGGYGGTGGRGGTGAVLGGNAYGEPSMPQLFGSGGGDASAVAGGGPSPGSGGGGGGILRLDVAGTLQVDGQVIVNGGNGTTPLYRAGGGSGGSILIQCGTLRGTGVIRADGGAGANSGGNSHAGGGGGGRIAVYTCNREMPLSQITANGGTGWQSGQPGSIDFGTTFVTVHGGPVGGTFSPGSIIVLNAEGAPEATSFVWRRNGLALVNGPSSGGGMISGQGTRTLTISNIGAFDSGRYDCVVEHSCGTTFSTPANLCYGNCDSSLVSPVLNVDDFTCFINTFASAQSLPHSEQVVSYANCDKSQVAPVLNVDDFTCFINVFAQGCQ